MVILGKSIKGAMKFEPRLAWAENVPEDEREAAAGSQTSITQEVRADQQR
jgi:hypothetical protein